VELSLQLWHAHLERGETKRSGQLTLIFAILIWMNTLAPGRSHIDNATAIATILLEEPPLFKGDEDRLRTAAFTVAIAFRESSFRNDVTSKTNDSCMMQIHSRPDLAEDPVACMRVAMTMLRESMRMCPDHPLAFYVSGPGACTNARSIRISNDRLAIARRLIATQKQKTREP
jgi:hypothetical protein